MQRCIDLALKGSGYVSPNPMVGSVLVYHDRIIGEGWHRQYGQAHAEVNCIASVKDDDRHLIAQSTLYVSLEPCAHYGKTPPCADLIVRSNIPKVVIGCVDSFSQVAGKGIEKLRAAGIAVVLNVMEKECRWLNRRFFCKQEKGRPYVIMKWAQSINGFLAPPLGQRVMLSNSYAQKWVHKMRSEEDAILVGFKTAQLDNPRLNNRFGIGKDPLRIAIDLDATLPRNLYIFDGSQPTIIFNLVQESEMENLRYIRLEAGEPIAPQVLQHLKQLNSVIIEGGARTLQLFTGTGLWDEAFVIQTPAMIDDGTVAPTLDARLLTGTLQLEDDTINHYRNEHSGRL